MMTMVVVSGVVVIFGVGGADAILREGNGEVRGKEESGEFTMELSNELLHQLPRVSNVML